MASDEKYNANGTKGAKGASILARLCLLRRCYPVEPPLRLLFAL